MFFFDFFSRRFVVCRFCTSRQCFGYSVMKKPFYIPYPKINPLRWIYFWRENKSKSRYDLFLIFFFFNQKKIVSVSCKQQLTTKSRYDLFLIFLHILVVDSSSASGQIPPSLPEIPIKQWTTTPHPPPLLAGNSLN